MSNVESPAPQTRRNRVWKWIILVLLLLIVAPPILSEVRASMIFSDWQAEIDGNLLRFERSPLSATRPTLSEALTWLKREGYEPYAHKEIVIGGATFHRYTIAHFHGTPLMLGPIPVGVRSIHIDLYFTEENIFITYTIRSVLDTV